MDHSISIARLLTMLVFCVMITAWATPALAVTLIQEGQALSTIVVPVEDQAILDAAEDLQYHLYKMSGAQVPIVYDVAQVSGVGIYIDTKPVDVHVPGRLIDRRVLWPDGYVIEILEFDDKTGVFLSSLVPEGLRNAVYGLLEDHLGCHWFTPGPIGEYIPQCPTVTLNISHNRDVAKPSFEKRMPWYNGNANRHLTVEETPQLVKWYRRNRHGEPRGSTGHGWHQMFTPEALKSIDEDSDGVSDLTPLVDGKRDPAFTGNGLCMSHPMVVDIAARWFIRFFDTHPEYDHWSFSQGDSMQFCECDRCAAMGSTHGGHLLLMSNAVIEKVNQVHPNKRITIMPYQATLEPPQEVIPANPNLNPIIVSMGVDQVQPKPQSPAFRRQVERWMTMLPRAWSYDYISWNSGPWPLFQPLQQTRDFYRHVGYTGVMDEYLGRNLGTDIHMWLSARMAWDADLRVEDLLNVFYPAYYGPAAEEMRLVYANLEQHMLSVGSVGTSMANLPQLYPAELMDEALAHVAQAKQKVSNNPTLVARVARDENCLKATQLWLRFWSRLGQANREADRAAREQAAQECRAYLDFVNGLNGTLTLGGGGMRLIAARLMEGLVGSGTFFSEGFRGAPWPGKFAYYDTLDQGGKITDTKSWSGFYIGPHGLYLKPYTVGEIIYDVRTTTDLRFKDVSLPGHRTGWDLAIRLALPEGGHNKIQISLDDGRTWTTAFEDVNTNIKVVKHDLTKYVGGTNQFLLKFWVQNADAEILALDTWVLEGTTEKAAPSGKM